MEEGVNKEIKMRKWNGWNYRIVKSIKDGEPEYRIVEAYYGEDGRVVGYCKAEAFGETAKELIADLKYMLKDARKYKEILNEADYPNG